MIITRSKWLYLVIQVWYKFPTKFQPRFVYINYPPILLQTFPDMTDVCLRFFLFFFIVGFVPIIEAFDAIYRERYTSFSLGQRSRQRFVPYLFACCLFTFYFLLFVYILNLLSRLFKMHFQPSLSWMYSNTARRSIRHITTNQRYYCHYIY